MAILLAETENVVEDKFGDDYPGYFWRVTNEPVDREKPDDLKLVTIEVFYQPDLEQQDSVSSLSDAKMLRKVGLLKAKRGALDLVEQAGLSEDQAELLRQTIPIAGFDPRAVDLQQLITMLDSDTIAQLLPMLMPLLQQIAAGGLPADLTGLADEIGGALGVEVGGSSPEDLAGAIKDAVGAQGQPPGGAKPPARPPGMAARPPAGGSKRPATPPPAPPAGGQINIGQGSGPNGEYTLEDLIRLRDEYERQQAGGQ